MIDFFTPKLYPLALLPYSESDWSSNFIWLHKQPIPLWSMAISMKIFGVNELALRLPSLLLSTIAIYLTYLIGKKLFNEKVGLLAAFFHAINGMAIEITGGRIATDHVDVFFMFFIEAAIVFAIFYSEKKNVYFNILSGLSIGIAVLCKWLPAYIVLPIWLALNFDNSRKWELVKGLFILILTSVIVFLPWQLYAFSRFPAEYSIEMNHNWRHIVEVLDNRTGGPLYFVEKLFISINEFIWVAFAYFCYRLWREKSSSTFNKRIALLIWMVIPFIFFSSIHTKMQAYLLFIFPPLFISLSEFGIFLLRVDIRYLRLRQFAFAVLVFLSVRYSIERIKPLQDQSKQIAWANAFKLLDKNNAEKRVYIDADHCIEGMFYTNSIMYGYHPSTEQIQRLKEEGYEVIDYQNPNL